MDDGSSGSYLCLTKATLIYIVSNGRQFVRWQPTCTTVNVIDIWDSSFTSFSSLPFSDTLFVA